MKIYAQICAVTPLETRTKKDGSGTYEYADVTLQVYDKDCHPGTHARYDWRTGDKLGDQPDVIRYDAVRDEAKRLAADGWQPGTVVVADIDVSVNQYGHNEVTVRGIERYQQSNQPRP